MSQQELLRPVVERLEDVALAYMRSWADRLGVKSLLDGVESEAEPIEPS